MSTTSEPASATLTEFLLARIAEDEAAANTAHLESMRGHAGPGFIRSRIAWAEQAQSVRGHALIKRFTPARVLAECEAKRGAIDEAWGDHVQIEGEWGMSQTREAMDAKGDVPGVIAHLASVYADHPDYRSEWRP